MTGLGDRAIVLTFDGPITVGTPMVGQPDMRALQSGDVFLTRLECEGWMRLAF